MKTDAQMHREVHDVADETIRLCRSLQRHPAHQSLDNGGAVHVADAKRFVAVPPEPLLSHQPFRGRSGHTRHSSLVWGVSFSQLSHPFFVRFFRMNLPNRDDLNWSRRITDVMINRHDRLPELGKYNAGQKMVFWRPVGPDHHHVRIGHRYLGPVLRHLHNYRDEKMGACGAPPLRLSSRSL